MEGRGNCYNGEITNIIGEKVAIYHLINALACKNYDLSVTLSEKFPYTDVYGAIDNLYSLNLSGS